MRKILILAANPKDTSRLRLDQEVRDITEGLKRSRYRDQFLPISKWAVRSRDLRRAILEEKPQIVHFSGHGEGEKGLCFEDQDGRSKWIAGSSLKSLFNLLALKTNIECVVLNSCYSQTQAEAIAEGVPYVIGMTRAVSDRLAIEFAVGFYDALGDGESIEFAFRCGQTAMSLNGADRKDLPILIQKNVHQTASISSQEKAEEDNKSTKARSAKDKEQQGHTLQSYETLLQRRNPLDVRVSYDSGKAILINGHFQVTKIEFSSWNRFKEEKFYFENLNRIVNESIQKKISNFPIELLLSTNRQTQNHLTNLINQAICYDTVRELKTSVRVNHQTKHLDGIENRTETSNREHFKKSTEKIRNLVRRLHDFLLPLCMNEVEAISLIELSLERIRPFRLIFIGDVNSGKSTLINALIGEKVLPASPIPTTLLLSELKWGKKKKALIHFKLQDDKPRTQKEIGIDNLEEYSARNILKDYAIEYNGGWDLEKIEVFLSNSYFQDGAEIVDSPGLFFNSIGSVDDSERFLIEEAIKDADACVFLMNSINCLSIKDTECISYIDSIRKKQGNTFSCFISTFADQLSTKDKDNIEKRVSVQLGHRSDIAKLLFVDARGALIGRLKKDQQQVYESGIFQIEERLKEVAVQYSLKKKFLRAVSITETFIEKMIRQKHFMAKVATGKKDIHELDLIELELNAIKAEISVSTQDFTQSP